MGLGKKPSENIVGKGEIAFKSNVFYTIKDRNYQFCYNLSSASASNLVWFKILLCGNGLRKFSQSVPQKTAVLLINLVAGSCDLNEYAS